MVNGLAPRSDDFCDDVFYGFGAVPTGDYADCVAGTEGGGGVCDNV